MDEQKLHCGDAKALVGQYLTGETLPDKQQHSLESHLEYCDDCRAFLDAKKAELLQALEGDQLAEAPVEEAAPPATPAPAPAPNSAADLLASLDSLDDNAVLDPNDIAALFAANNSAPAATPEPEPAPVAEAPAEAAEELVPAVEKEEVVAALTKEDMEAMLGEAIAEAEPAPVPVPEPVAEATPTPEPAAEPEPVVAEVAPAQDFELVFDEDELPEIGAGHDAVEEVSESEPEVPAAFEGPAALDDADLDALLSSIPEPVPVPATTPEPVAQVAAEAVAEPEPESEEAPAKPKVRLQVEGLPILLSKNLKTLAYSLSLGLVLVAMTTFAKNPSTLFGPRAAEPVATQQEDKHADPAPESEHKPLPVKPTGHEDVQPTKTEEVKTDKPNEAEPLDQPSHLHDKPNTDKVVSRMSKFETKAETAERRQREEEAQAQADHANLGSSAKPKTAAHGQTHAVTDPTSVHQENSFMVANGHGKTAKVTTKRTTKPAPKVATKTSHAPAAPKHTAKPATRPTQHASSPTTKRKTRKPTTRKQAPRKAPAHNGLKIYDEHGNPIN